MPVRVRFCAVLLLFALLLPGAALGAGGYGIVATGATGLDGIFFTTSGRTLKAATAVVGGGLVTASGDGGSVTSFPLTITGGFSDRIELGLSWAVLTKSDPEGFSSESGVGDLDLRAKYSLQGETPSLPAVAVFGHVKLPTAEEGKGLGTGETDFGVGVAADKDFGGVQGMVNLEYTLVGDDRPAGNQLNWALGLRIPYTETTRFSLEFIDQYQISSSWVGGDFLLGGVSVDLPPSINLALHLGLGLNKDNPDFLVGALFGLTL